jgi:hypothetical protein
MSINIPGVTPPTASAIIRMDCSTALTVYTAARMQGPCKCMQCGAVRCDAIRYDAMGWDAMGWDAMGWGAVRCGATRHAAPRAAYTATATYISGRMLSRIFEFFT